MGDVSDILGLAAKSAPSASDEATRILSDKPKVVSNTVKKPKGMSREVFRLLGPDNIVSSVQATVPVAAQFKMKRSSALRGKWIWAPFAKDSHSSLETSPLYHWAKADLPSTEYPYSKFNIQLNKVTYSEEEYDAWLQTPDWTRSETDALMHYCHLFDLRWPVIYDRFSPQPPRKVEDLQERYYSILLRLRQCRSESDGNPKINEQASVFDLTTEKLRRKQQDEAYYKTREEEKEEAAMREELKQIEANMRKLKKSNKAASNSNAAAAASGGDKDKDKDYALPPAVVVQAVVHPPPVLPSQGIPGLQSGRLLVPIDQDTSLSKTFSKKVSVLLKELKIPEGMVPTRAVCDLYDQIRRDACALVSLQTAVQKREKEVSGLRNSVPAEVVAALTASSSSSSRASGAVPLSVTHSTLTSSLAPVGMMQRPTPAAIQALSGNMVPLGGGNSAGSNADRRSASNFDSNQAMSLDLTGANTGVLPPVPKKSNKRKSAAAAANDDAKSTNNSVISGEGDGSSVVAPKSVAQKAVKKPRKSAAATVDNANTVNNMNVTNNNANATMNMNTGTGTN